MQDQPVPSAFPRPRYRTAQIGGRVIAGLGWTILASGMLGGAIEAWRAKDLSDLAVGGLVSIAGFSMIVAGQLIQAVIANASQTRELLTLLESGPLHWATRPPQATSPAPRTDRTADQAAWLRTPSAPISPEMRSSVASESVSPCVNPFCGRLLPEQTEVCPHCRTRQRRQPS